MKNEEEYKGNFTNGLRSGYGELKLSDGALFKGEWRNDMINGKGVFTWPNGRSYSG